MLKDALSNPIKARQMIIEYILFKNIVHKGILLRHSVNSIQCPKKLGPTHLENQSEAEFSLLDVDPM